MLSCQAHLRRAAILGFRDASRADTESPQTRPSSVCLDQYSGCSSPRARLSTEWKVHPNWVPRFNSQELDAVVTWRGFSIGHGQLNSERKPRAHRCSQPQSSSCCPQASFALGYISALDTQTCISPARVFVNHFCNASPNFVSTTICLMTTSTNRKDQACLR